MTIDARELLEGTTAGPWFASPYRGQIGSQVWAGEPGPNAVLILEEGDADRDADARLCAAAPALARDNIAKDAIIEAQSATIERMREALVEIEGMQGEINPSNYDYDDVCFLNSQFIESAMIARAALATKDEA